MSSLGFDDRQGHVPCISKQEVGPFLGTTHGLPTDDHDPAVGEGLLLFIRVRRLVPSCCFDLRPDKLTAGISFVHRPCSRGAGAATDGEFPCLDANLPSCRFLRRPETSIMPSRPT